MDQKNLTVKSWLKPKKPTGVKYDQLTKLDRRYFKPQGEDKEELTNQQAIHRLATWLFDNEGDATNCRKKLKAQLPQIYVEVLEHFVDGDHDT